MREKMIGYLLNNANPSIQYRVKTEVLNQELSAREKDQLQEKILREPIIQSIISCQKENGWLGNGLHGASDYALFKERIRTRKESWNEFWNESINRGISVQC